MDTILHSFVFTSLSDNCFLFLNCALLTEYKNECEKSVIIEIHMDIHKLTISAIAFI